MAKLKGESTQGHERMMECGKDPARGYWLWIAAPDSTGNLKGGHSIYIDPKSVSDEAVRDALDVLCR